jgi:hypothetical protein
VDVFTTEGVLVKRLITAGQLDSPWGLARVPEHEHFGKFHDEVLLVGNYFTAGIVDEAHGLFGFIHRQENEDSDN